MTGLDWTGLERSNTIDAGYSVILEMQLDFQDRDQENGEHRPCVFREDGEPCLFTASGLVQIIHSLLIHCAGTAWCTIRTPSFLQIVNSVALCCPTTSLARLSITENIAHDRECFCMVVVAVQGAPHCCGSLVYDM